MNSLYHPEKIIVEKSALEHRLTHDILKRLPNVPVEEPEDVRAVIEQLKQKADPIGAGKRILFLGEDRGRSFKPFPESENYWSCDYYTLHLSEGCDLECSYCILQAYLTNPMIVVYTNIDPILENLKRTLDQNPARFFRIGTGQLADSLSLDHLTAASEKLVPFFAKQKNATLELKTKSTNIDRLLSLDPKGKTIVSWSINSKFVQEREEHKCATIEERITAARKLIDAQSYQLGFHLDPLIDYTDWKRDYEEVIEKLFSEIPEDRIAWISLGCLRFIKSLKPIMQDRFPKSKLALGQWITGMDGKMRYFKPRRIEMYREIISMIRKKAPNLTLYLTMESPEVWRKVFNEDFTKDHICQMLDESAGSLKKSVEHPA